MKTDNELIAEFMGSKPYEDSRYGTMWPDPTNDNKVGFGLYYDKKWDWLKPVIGTIADLGLAYEDMLLCDWYNDVTKYSITVNIDVVYIAVVEFIKWYNQRQRTYLEQNGPKV